MKGLITKDICLLLRQKNMLLMMVLILLLLSRNGLEFTLGYFIFICFFLGESTIGHDAADRGLAYLMTLPVNRKIYVLEKYVLVLLPGVVATALAIAMRFAAALIQQQPADSLEIIVSCIGIFFATSLLAAVFLPIELLGMEKARIVITIGAAAFGVGFYMLMQNEDALRSIMMHAMEAVEGMSKAGLGIGAVGIWLVMMISSALCSMFIMAKKEF